MRIFIFFFLLTSCVYAQEFPFAIFQGATSNPAAIAGPTLITPTDGAIGQAQSPTLIWSRLEGEGFYSVQISQSESFSNVPWSINTFDTIQAITTVLDEGTKWYWRVRYQNSDTSEWSSTFSFAVTEGTQIARAYYIDATNGLDEYNGRATDKAWKTLDKVSSFTFIAGDTILFKGGEIFTGSIKTMLTHDDTTQAVSFSSYGTGKAKILMGASDSNGVRVRFTKHVKINISNLVIEGMYNPVTETGGGNIQRGVYVWNWDVISPLDSNKISQVNINNCEIYNIRNVGISIIPGDYGKTISAKVDSNTIYNIGGAGITMYYNWYGNSRIYGNTIHDIYGISSNLYDKAIIIGICKDVLIERNLVYNIGNNNIVSGIGIISTASKNIRIRYNEIYNIVSNTAQDAQAINLENGTDSSLVECNYIHDTRMGILISGNNSFNSITQSYLTYVSERGSIDSGSADYNVVRFNLIKNLTSSVTSGFSAINISSGLESPSHPGKNNQIYNNTIIFPFKTPTETYAIKFNGNSDSTKIFNNLIIGDSLVNFISDTLSTKTNTYVNNNIYWDRDKSYTVFWREGPFSSYTSFNTWNTHTGWETSRLGYNPLLNNPYSITGDTLNNPFLIDTISKYIPIYESIANENGVELISYTRSAPTYDIRGLPAYKNGKYSIGAYTDTTTSTYNYQNETIRWIGRMDTLQTTAQMQIKDSLIMFMKRDTLLSKLDLFYIFANLDSTSAKLNIISDTFNVVAINSPTFTTQEGYTGNGSSAYLNTVWTPSLHSNNFSLNDAHISVYSMSNISEDRSLLGTNNNSTAYIRIAPNNSAGSYVGSVNDTILKTTSNTTTIGLFTVSRTSSTTTHLYKNDTLLNSPASNSSSLTTSPLFLLARNSNGAPASYTTGKISAVTVGESINQHSQYRLTDNLEFYLNRIGIPKTSLKPVLISPANNDTGVSLSATLYWSKINNKTSYHIQMSFYSNFSALIGEMTNVDTNAYFINGSNPGSLGSVTLSPNQTVYWRVRGINSAGNGAWSNTSVFTTPVTYDIASVSLFSRFPYAISEERKDLIDSLIKQLKSDTIWDKIDVLYMYASDDTANAKLNWKSSSYTSSLNGSTKPSFTANQGFTGNGLTSYINTNWIPSTHGVNYLKDSSSVFVYVRTNATEDAFVLGTYSGSGAIRFNPRSTANSAQTMFNNITLSNAMTSVVEGKGFYSIIRDNAVNYKLYRNDILEGTVTQASTGLSVQPLFTLAQDAGGSASSFTTRQLSMVAAGGKFSAYTQSVFARRIEWFLNRLGAFVGVPSAPILITPHDTATGVNDTPSMDWDDVGADSYEIEIDDFPAFATQEVQETVYGSEFLSVTDPLLLANTTYYWRVRGINVNGAGAWSSTFSFTTAP